MGRGGLLSRLLSRETEQPQTIVRLPAPFGDLCVRDCRLARVVLVCGNFSAIFFRELEGWSDARNRFFKQ